jgi:hypothetical protein
LIRIEKLKSRHDVLADGETIDDDPLDQKVSSTTLLDKLKRALTNNIMGQLSDATQGI